MKQKPLSLRQALKHKLSPQQLKLVKRSFDVVGDVAILEIPKELKAKAKLIGQTFLKLYPHIHVVLAKAGPHKGKYRRQKLQHLAGQKRTITEHKESGLRLMVDVEKCYFSPRLASERLRIARQVQPGEVVLVGFSGIGAYPLVIAKNTHASKIIGIELNPVAHNFAVQNALLNKLGHRVILLKGDVKKVLPKLKQKFDRIILPMPKGGLGFLPVILKHSTKRGTLVHSYDFAKEDEFKLAEQRVLGVCKRAGKRCKVIQTVKAGQHAPRTFRVCVEFKII